MAKSGDNTLPILTHVLGLITGFIGPLIILLVAEDKRSKNHAKAALNWQFSVLIYLVISFVLILILVGFLLIFVVAILNIVFSIIAAVKAGNNELWKYPLSIPFFNI